MARVAKPRTRTLLLVAVLLPLWSSYLVRIYAWRTILGHDGALNWTLNKIGLAGRRPALHELGDVIVFTYIWLPFMVIPVYAALERIPDNFLEASADLGAKGWRTFRSVLLPLALPGHHRRLDLHVLAHSRRLHHAAPDRRRQEQLHRQRRRELHRHQLEHPVRGRLRIVPVLVMAVYLLDRAPARRLRGACDGDKGARIGLRIWTIAVVALPLDPDPDHPRLRLQQSNIQSWPITSWTTHWFSAAWNDPDVRSSLWLSLKCGLIATGDRARARLDGLVRHQPLQVLRPRVGHVPAASAARAPRDHHRAWR